MHNQDYIPQIIDEANCPFNGFVYIFKDSTGTWVEHQRDGKEPIITDYLPISECKQRFQKFINNTIF